MRRAAAVCGFGRLGERSRMAAPRSTQGHRVPRRRPNVAGLTARELDVLRLLARGLTNKDIAAALVISRKTVSNHVEHIYAKSGASTRAAASYFATTHGLLAAPAE
jgi:DNA-binding NarL/FixJ family response regulator